MFNLLSVTMKIRYFLSLFITILLLPSGYGYGQGTTANHQQRLLQSFMSGDMSDWVRVIEGLKGEYKKTLSTAILYDLTHAQYGYIGYLIGAKQTKQARQVLAEAEANIDLLLNSHPRNANALAIKGALVAYHISLSPLKAPFLGPRSVALIDESISIDPNAAQALIEKGNAAHYAPSMFGGNPIEAIKFYTMAISTLEKQNSGSNRNTWLYLNTQAQLALAFEKAKQIDNAKKTYLNILKIAPDFKWVRDELYPKFLVSNDLL